MLNNNASNGRNIISGQVIFDNEYQIVSADENFYRFISPMLTKITDAIHQIEMDDFYAVIAELSAYSTSTMVMRLRRFDNSYRWTIAVLKQANNTPDNDKTYYEMHVSDIINLHNHYTALTSMFNPKKSHILYKNTKKMEDMLNDARKHFEDTPADQLHFGLIGIDNVQDITEKYGEEFVEKVMNDVITQLYESIGDSRFIAHTEDGKIGFYVVNLGIELNMRSFLEALRNQVHWKYMSENPGERVEIYMSIGVSEYPRNGRDIENVIDKMYHAYNLAVTKGRNRYIIFKEEIHGE